MSDNIFDDIINRKTLFVNKDLLRDNHTPSKLPHRTKEIKALSMNLVEALNGNIPSNMTLYGVTGAGKTAVASYVCDQLETKGSRIGRNVNTIMVNCRQIDTQYRVLAHIGNSLSESYEIDEIPFTGWPVDRVFSELVKRMDAKGGVFIIVLDEIDHLVKKAGDDLLYNLTNLNQSLKNSRSCVIGISNDLKFTDFLDPRVRSRLGQLDVIFNPYDASQLQDILRQRSATSIKEGVLERWRHCQLCAALAAQEHGDARCALELLRVSTEKADARMVEATQSWTTSRTHGSITKSKRDQMTPVISSLAQTAKIGSVRFSTNLNEKIRSSKNIETGEVQDVYATSMPLSVGQNALTQTPSYRMLISNLDMLGLITARAISQVADMGRTKEINSCIPSKCRPSMKIMGEAESGDGRKYSTRPYRHQTRL